MIRSDDYQIITHSGHSRWLPLFGIAKLVDTTPIYHGLLYMNNTEVHAVCNQLIAKKYGVYECLCLWYIYWLLYWHIPIVNGGFSSTNLNSSPGVRGTVRWGLLAPLGRVELLMLGMQYAEWDVACMAQEEGGRRDGQKLGKEGAKKCWRSFVGVCFGESKLCHSRVKWWFVIRLGVTKIFVFVMFGVFSVILSQPGWDGSGKSSKFHWASYTIVKCNKLPDITSIR